MDLDYFQDTFVKMHGFGYDIENDWEELHEKDFKLVPQFWNAVRFYMVEEVIYEHELDVMALMPWFHVHLKSSEKA